MKKIGIMTWHYYHNFGSMLQAYALQRFLKKNSYKVRIVNYKNTLYVNVGFKEFAKKYVKFFLAIVSNLFPFVKRIYKSLGFISFSMRMKKTTEVFDSENVSSQLEKFDCIICGSDQIWAPNVYNPIYMLDGLAEGKKKISYAVSIGLNEIPKELENEYAKNISRYSAISVREEKGKEILKKQCGIESNLVLDPTFLLSAGEWRSLESHSNISYLKRKKFIFCYFLNNNHSYRETVLEYAKNKELEIVGVSLCENDNVWMSKLSFIGPREFLWLVDNSEFVFTDSYHGLIFSLLFHKPFIVFERFRDDDGINQNSRIYQLMNYFNIQRYVFKNSSPENNEIPNFSFDYDDFENTLKKHRSLSVNFLINAIED